MIGASVHPLLWSPVDLARSEQQLDHHLVSILCPLMRVGSAPKEFSESWLTWPVANDILTTALWPFIAAYDSGVRPSEFASQGQAHS